MVALPLARFSNQSNDTPTRRLEWQGYEHHEGVGYTISLVGLIKDSS